MSVLSLLPKRSIVAKGSKNKGSSGNKPPPPKASKKTVSPPLQDFPKGHDKVVTNGGGGKDQILIKEGVWNGWYFGGAKRSEVRGNMSHPITPGNNTLRWGFPPMQLYVDAYPSDAALQAYYKSLPQNFGHPGGQLVEVMITPLNVTCDEIKLGSQSNCTTTPTLPFFFVSDNYTALQVSDIIGSNCSALVISHPIPFNSTGNIRPGSIVQFYRGGSAVMILQDYHNPNPSLVPNPPFPSNVSTGAWTCMNMAIGNSIPLLAGAHSEEWKRKHIMAPILAVFMTLIFLWIWICIRRSLGKRKRQEDYDRLHNSGYY